MTSLRLLQESLRQDIIFLNDLLKWHSTNGRNKYSHFQVHNGKAQFVVYEGEETALLEWNLDFVTLNRQNQDLIDWLATLI